MSKIEAVFGAWPSAFSAEAIAGSTLRFGQIQADGDTLYWTEMRPLEGGRSAIVRCGRDGVVSDVVAPPYSARSRIHEYGGGELLVAEGTIYFVNAEDQDVYAVPPDGGVTRLTDAPDVRFGDMTLDARRNRLICVAERHAGEHDPMPVNSLVAIPLDGDAFSELASGNDFYSSPALSDDGSQLAWLEWSLPSMPWEAATLNVANLDDAGTPAAATVVAGGDGSAAFQPTWSQEGKLVFVWNTSGWGNLHEWDGTQARVLAEHSAEFAHPQWVLGMRSFALLPDGSVFASFMEQGAFKCGTISAGTGALTQIDCEARSFQAVTAFGNSVAALVTFDDRPSAIVVIENPQGADAVIRKIRPSASIKIDAGDVSVGQAVSFASETGGVAYATYYQPTSAGHCGPAGERPPAIVLVHGGPTGSADRGFKPKTQYWTSRGFAVIDVDFTGSFGYGRAYREALNGAWGTADGADAAAAARWLIANGLADAQKVAISGGSSGGYTALCALMNHDVFAAAAVYYGISDVALLAQSTHKFESGYVSTLTALPQDAPEEAYRSLSPVHNAERIKSPVILFQGLEDRVVPPDQSEAIAEELGGRGIPVAYLAFEGEAHGFRSADTLIEATRSEHAFFARIMGLDPADDLPPLEIRNMGSRT